APGGIVELVAPLALHDRERLGVPRVAGDLRPIAARGPRVIGVEVHDVGEDLEALEEGGAVVVVARRDDDAQVRRGHRAQLTHADSAGVENARGLSSNESPEKEGPPCSPSSATSRSPTLPTPRTWPRSRKPAPRSRRASASSSTSSSAASAGRRRTSGPRSTRG